MRKIFAKVEVYKSRNRKNRVYFNLTLPQTPSESVSEEKTIIADSQASEKHLYQNLKQWVSDAYIVDDLMSITHSGWKRK